MSEYHILSDPADMRMLYCFLSAFLALLNPVVCRGVIPNELDSDVADSLVSLMSTRSLDPVEGIWRVAGFRSVIAVVGAGRDAYDIIAVDVDAPSVLPGTLIGTARPTAKDGTYDAEIYTKASPDGKMHRKADFIITVDMSLRRLTLKHYFKGIAVRMWRSIPYLFGATLRNRDTRPDDIDGCLRIWPEPDRPTGIITL